MDKELTRYLNDHLAGSSGALILVDHLASHHANSQARQFFAKLKSDIEQDRKVLEKLLEKVGQNPSLFLKAAGDVMARVSGLKLMWENLKPGGLGLFEALELLAIGIQGKRLLWSVLLVLQPLFPEWRGFDLQRLLIEATAQRDEVEKWRIEAACESLVSQERGEATPIP